MKVGVISDTHNFLDPRVVELFQGVDHILHAGDVGQAWITFQLGQIAPVTAVLGNTDTGMHFRTVEVVELGGRKFLLQHIVDPQRLDDALSRRIARERPDMVVFGHSHKPFDAVVNGTRFFNPGYAGQPRFNQPRSLAVFHWGADGINVERLPL